MVVAIVAFLVAGAIATFTSVTEQRSYDETVRRLNASVDAIIAFAVINRRLPCPALVSTTGVESPAGGGTCSTSYAGFVPGITVGAQPTDSSGYVVDSWGNRIRYAVAGVAAPLAGCTGSSTVPHFTSQANLKANGVSCKPGITDLDICTTSVGINATSCNTANRLASQSTIAFIVFSTGKNGAVVASYGADETANTNGDAVFVSRPPSDSTATNGNFDDIVVIVPAGVLYQKLIAAGALP